MQLHEINIKWEYLKEIQAGRMNFEYRRYDRPYQVGDLIKFNCVDSDKIFKVPAEYTMDNECYIQEDTLYKITSILKDVPERGLDTDYCIIGIRKVVIKEV